MSIFNNNKSKNNSSQDVNLTDYERKLRERHDEYNHLKEILRGMRAEVSNLMDEIKDVTDNLVRKNAELFLLEESINDLKRSYELLKQDIKYEEETFNKVNSELIKIKSELNVNMPLFHKLNVLKIEYESVLLHLNARKTELEKANSQIIPLKSANNKNSSKINLGTQFIKNKKKCQAKTKLGSKCKRYAVEGSLYCARHLANINSN